jgi:hypothetical protein
MIIRKMAENKMREEAERIAKARGSEIVEEAGLVHAIRNSVPNFERKQAIKILQNAGVNAEKYFKKYELFQI